MLCSVSCFGKTVKLKQKRKTKVSIVDDSHLITVRLSELVREIGYVSDIFVANTLTQAIAINVKQQPHVVLLNIYVEKEN